MPLTLRYAISKTNSQRRRKQQHNTTQRTQRAAIGGLFYLNHEPERRITQNMPRRKNKAIAALHGSIDKRNGIASPVSLPPLTRISVPSYLSKQETAIYKKIGAALVAQRLLTELDLGLVETYATVYATYMQAAATLRESGPSYESKGRWYSHPTLETVRKCSAEMRQLASRLGLSIRDRQSIEAAPIETEEDDNIAPADWDDLGLYEGKDERNDLHS
jgi:P27 family predicted phage terminase small subunit